MPDPQDVNVHLQGDDVGEAIPMILWRRPVQLEELARNFAQGRKVEKRIEFTLKALARMGAATSGDGKRFAIRRSS